jgi:hypothetical protein
MKETFALGSSGGRSFIQLRLRVLALVGLGLIAATAGACNDTRPAPARVSPGPVASTPADQAAAQQPSTPVPQSSAAAPAPPPAPAQAAGPLHGTVVWPDGNPARNVGIALFPYNHRSAYSLTENPEYDIRTDQYGRYQVEMCPCASLNAWLDIVSFDGAFNSGNACMIKMTPNGQTYTGIQADAGQQINWMIGPKNCDRMLLEYDPSSNDPDAATWRQAERWSLTHPQ